MIIPAGLGIWFKFGLLIGSVGAAVMPAGPPEDHVTSKLEPAGKRRIPLACCQFSLVWPLAAHPLLLVSATVAVSYLPSSVVSPRQVQLAVQLLACSSL